MSTNTIIDNLVTSLNTTKGIEGYLFPTQKELDKMIVCGKCKHNKPFNLITKDKIVNTRFCTENFHYVENNTIQLSCHFNKQHLLKDTLWNRLKLKFTK